MSKHKIQIDGLDALSRSLRDVGKKAPKEIKGFTTEVANLILVKGRALVPSRSGKARRSWRAVGSAKGASVEYGGAGAPYMGWLDHGGRVGRKKSVLRPYLRAGRYLYPTIAKYKPQTQKIADEAMADIARSAGLKVD